MAQVWGYRASILRLARRGSQVHLGVASSQEGRIGAQVQLEELPISADSVVGPERRGLRRLRAALPPAEVVALREHFAKLIDPRGGHHFVGGQCPHQGFLPGMQVNFPRPGDEERELVEQPRQPLGHPHGSFHRGIPTRVAKPSRPPPSRLPRAPLPLLPLARRSPRRQSRRLSSLQSSNPSPGPARRATPPASGP